MIKVRMTDCSQYNVKSSLEMVKMVNNNLLPISGELLKGPVIITISNMPYNYMIYLLIDGQRFLSIEEWLDNLSAEDQVEAIFNMNKLQHPEDFCIEMWEPPCHLV